MAATARYRRLPKEVEAIRFTRNSKSEVINFGGNKVNGFSIPKCKNCTARCVISSKYGSMVVSEGSYIIKDLIDGSLFALREDAFLDEYERII